MISLERARQLRTMIEKASSSLNDADALDAKELYSVWKPDTAYVIGQRFRYDGKLWRVRQAHTSSAIYPPSIDTAALYEEVARPGQGDTQDNPIPYNQNMALLAGKYYSEDGVVYRCTRDTVVAVYNPLSALVGLYVELV